MKYMKDTLDFQLNKRSVVTLGKFDGLHRGHDKLISRTIELGKKGYETVVFTFDVSPLVKLGTKITRTLITNEERKFLLEQKGIDCLVECPFVPEVIQMEAEDFIREILATQLRAAYIVVGPDFRFGHNRRGTTQLLKEMEHKYGYHVEILEKEMESDIQAESVNEKHENWDVLSQEARQDTPVNDMREISSTWIRETLREGNIERVNHLLGYPYFVKAKVVRGRQLGRTWGLPTINQIPENGKLLPPFGVYATKTYIDGKEFFGISNVGVKPTVAVPFAGVETYLFDCNENLYEKDAWVEFYHFVRPECKFDSVEELRDQIQRDVVSGKRYFSVKG